MIHLSPLCRSESLNAFLNSSDCISAVKAATIWSTLFPEGDDGAAGASAVGAGAGATGIVLMTGTAGSAGGITGPAVGIGVSAATGRAA